MNFGILLIQGLVNSLGAAAMAAFAAAAKILVGNSCCSSYGGICSSGKNIWWAIPIGWFAAAVTGSWYWKRISVKGKRKE